MLAAVATCVVVVCVAQGRGHPDTRELSNEPPQNLSSDGVTDKPLVVETEERHSVVKKSGVEDQAPVEEGPLRRMRRSVGDGGGQENSFLQDLLQHLVDTGVVDKGVVDQGVVDQGVVDKGVVDQGVVDKGVVDQGVVDKGVVDKGVVDKGVVDQGVVDQGGQDKGGQDKGGHDKGEQDKGGHDKGGHGKGEHDRSALEHHEPHVYKKTSEEVSPDGSIHTRRSETVIVDDSEDPAGVLSKIFHIITSLFPNQVMGYKLLGPDVEMNVKVGEAGEAQADDKKDETTVVYPSSQLTPGKELSDEYLPPVMPSDEMQCSGWLHCALKYIYKFFHRCLHSAKSWFSTGNSQLMERVILPSNDDDADCDSTKYVTTSPVGSKDLVSENTNDLEKITAFSVHAHALNGKAKKSAWLAGNMERQKHINARASGVKIRKTTIKPSSQQTIKLSSQQIIKPSSQQTIKLSSQQTIKPSSQQTIKPSSQQAIKPPSQQTIKLSSQQIIKPSSQQIIKTSSQQTIKPSSQQTIKLSSQQIIKTSSQQIIKPSSQQTIKPPSHAKLSSQDDKALSRGQDNSGRIVLKWTGGDSPLFFRPHHRQPRVIGA